ELAWCSARFETAQWIVNNADFVVRNRLAMANAAAWHAPILLVFAAAPSVCGTRRTWPWFIAAVAGLPQFWFVHQYLTVKTGSSPGQSILPHQLVWILPVAFALPAAGGILYLVRRENVSPSSADNQLASQGA